MNPVYVNRPDSCHLDDTIGSFIGSVTPTRIDGSPLHNSRYITLNRTRFESFESLSNLFFQARDVKKLRRQQELYRGYLAHLIKAHAVEFYVRITTRLASHFNFHSFVISTSCCLNSKVYLNVKDPQALTNAPGVTQALYHYLIAEKFEDVHFFFFG
jgi:hypothetical protein